MPSPIAPFVAPQASAPPAAPPAAPRAPAAHPFAEMLRQTRHAGPVAPTPPPAPEADTAEAPDPAHPPAPAKARPRNAAAPAAQRSATPQAPAKDGADATTTKPADHAADAGNASNDNGLAQWIADLQWRAPGQADTAREAREATTSDAAQDLDGIARAARRDSGGTADARRPDADAKDAATRDTLDRGAATRAENAAAIDADAPRRAGETAPAARAEPGAAPALGLAAPQAPSGAAAPPTAEVTLPTPLHAPDFAQALGVQVSLLAKDGVEHAELHLNPADMGPVSVQIVMDGTQARIEFGADLAQTRHALEAGIPELASALRDAGLTLSGGGVSEHARGRGDGGSDPGRERRLPEGEVAARAEPSGGARRRFAAAGGVDVYA